MTNSTIAILPARGGSKSVPLKNIRPLTGKPLIAYSIEAALKCPLIDRVIVSTDSEEIARVSQEYGAEVPFRRPDAIAGDSTPDLPVFEHCLAWLKEHEGFAPDQVVHLRPTSPFREPHIIGEAIRILQKHPSADSVRAVCEPRQNPFKMWRISSEGWMKPLIESDIHEAYNQPRQALPTVYWQIGYIDVVRRATIVEGKSMTGNNILPLILDSWDAVDIDSELDFEIAEAIMKRKRI